MSVRIAVTGVGMVTAVGPDAPATWAALLAGRSGVGRQTDLARAGLATTMGAAIDGLARDDPYDREHALACSAIDEALGQAGRSAADVAIVWAAGLDAVSLDPTYRRRPSWALFAALTERFAPPRRRVASACASGAQAIGEGARLLASGGAAACVVGGSSAMLTPFYVHGLGQLGVLARDRDDGAVCRPFDRRRAGIALGDGAAALVLEPVAVARARGAAVLAEVLGAATSHDAHDFFKPPRGGQGAERAIRAALADAGLQAGEVGGVIAHATGTLDGDLAEAAALARVLGDRWPEVPVSASKGAVGHTMMAAGAVAGGLATLALRHRQLPPTAHLADPDPACALHHVRGRPCEVSARPILVHAFGMGGHNVVLVVGPAGWGER
jgi:3-oxoacyl-[acyl-carrier-protein] synthase II